MAGVIKRHNDKLEQAKALVSKLTHEEMQRSNGYPYDLMVDQKRKVRALIKRGCCNYDNGYCDLLDNGSFVKCPQVDKDKIWCKYFRESVLPIDPILEADIFCDLPKREVTEDIKKLKSCDICGRSFKPPAKNTIHCPKCAIETHRKQQAEYARKRRSESTK